MINTGDWDTYTDWGIHACIPMRTTKSKTYANVNLENKDDISFEEKVVKQTYELSKKQRYPPEHP